MVLSNKQIFEMAARCQPPDTTMLDEQLHADVTRSHDERILREIMAARIIEWLEAETGNDACRYSVNVALVKKRCVVESVIVRSSVGCEDADNKLANKMIVAPGKKPRVSALSDDTMTSYLADDLTSALTDLNNDIKECVS